MSKRPGFLLTDRFVEYRTLAGLTQAELAERLGTDQATVSKLERRVRGMSHAYATRLAAAFGIKLTTMLRRELIELTTTGAKGEAR